MNRDHQAITEQGFSGSLCLKGSDIPHIHHIKVKYELPRILARIEALIIDGQSGRFMLSFVRYHLTPQWLKDKINPITEIHIECLDKTHGKIVRWARKNKNAMLMFMPQNADQVKHVLSAVNNPVGLHVHICDDVYTDALPLPNYSEQLGKIREGLDFLEDLKLQVSDFASGHWSYDFSTFKACKELGLTRVHVKCKIIPTTLSCGIPEGINIIPVHKHLHDYDFIGGLKC